MKQERRRRRPSYELKDPVLQERRATDLESRKQKLFEANETLTQVRRAAVKVAHASKLRPGNLGLKLEL